MTQAPDRATEFGKGTIWAFGGRVITTGAVLGANVLLTRLLPQNEIGTYFLAFSVVTVAATVGRGGLPRAVVRLVPRQLVHDEAASGPDDARRRLDDSFPRRTRSLVLTSAALALIAGVVVLVAFAAGGGNFIGLRVFGSRTLGSMGMLLGIWAALESSRFVFSETLRGFGDVPRATAYGDAFRALLFLLSVLALGVVGVEHARDVVVAAIVASGVATVVAGKALRNRYRRLPPAAFRPYAPILPIALTLLVADLTMMIIDQADTWVVGATRSASEVALYGAAVRVGMVLAIPTFVVNAVIAPAVSALHTRGERHAVERTVRAAATLGAVPMTAMFVVIAVFGDRVMALLFGSGYGAAGLVVTILAAGQAINVATGPCTITLVMTGYERVVMLVFLVAGCMTVLFEVLLAAPFRLTGVAIASAAGTAGANLVLLVVAHRELGVWTHARVMPRYWRSSLAEFRG